jgi:hypothetical protein
LFTAAISPDTLKDEKTSISNAIEQNPDIWKAIIEQIAGDIDVPHRAFMIYPGDERRKLLGCLIAPISDWVLDLILTTLNSRDAEAAYQLYLRLDGSPWAASFRGQIWERHVHRYFRNNSDLSFTIKSLEDNDSSTMRLEPFKDMLTFNFGPAKTLVGHLHKCIAANKAGYFQSKSRNFASFDAIIYQPNSPLLGAQMTVSHDHGIKVRGPESLQKLLSRSDDAFNSLRPLVNKPWTILFIVPDPMQNTFKLQKFKPNADTIWNQKTKQYVLGLDKHDVFHKSVSREIV